MVEKQATGIELPVTLTSQNGVIITLPDGTKARTFPKKINYVSYNKGYLFITFTTRNSIYRDIPLRVMPQYGYFDGQIITEGYTVVNGRGTYSTVREILEVNQKGIIISTDEGDMKADIAFVCK